MSLESCLKPVQESADKDFRVEMMLNQNRFFAGQDARAILTVNRDAFLYIYSVDFDQNAIQVFPMEGATENKVIAGKPFSFPNAKHREDGILFLAELPKGSKNSVEMLRVIATKDDVGELLRGAKTYPELVRKLEQAGTDWSEDVRVFTIYKK